MIPIRKIAVVVSMVAALGAPAAAASTAIECVALKLKKARLRADDWSAEVALGDKVSRRDAETVARAIKRNQIVYRVTPDDFRIAPDLTQLKIVGIPQPRDLSDLERGVKYLELNMDVPGVVCGGVTYIVSLRGSHVELLRITRWIG